MFCILKHLLILLISFRTLDWTDRQAKPLVYAWLWREQQQQTWSLELATRESIPPLKMVVLSDRTDYLATAKKMDVMSPNLGMSSKKLLSMPR